MVMKDATSLTPPSPKAHERNYIVKCKQIQPMIPENQKKTLHNQMNNTIIYQCTYMSLPTI